MTRLQTNTEEQTRKNKLSSPADGVSRCCRMNIGGAAPPLVSSCGRYVWSEQPFTFTIEDGGTHLRLETEDTKAEGAETVAADGFGTLAGAYQAARRRFFPPRGLMPDPLNFTSPQYNSWIEMQYRPTEAKILTYARQITGSGL